MRVPIHWLALLLTAVFAAGCGGIVDAPADSVLLRVYNNSEHDFDSVTVNGRSMGRIPSGEFGEYARFEEAYHYGAVEVAIRGKRLGIYPIDYVGETPLPPGRYTYLISADPEADGLSLYFFEGDRLPHGPQVPGRNRLVSVEHRFEGFAGVRAPDGGVVVSGSRWTLRLYNPTVSDRPGSGVIYLPDARVYGSERQGLLAALDAAGSVRWTRAVGEAGLGDRAVEGLVPAADGGYLLGGRFEHFQPGAHPVGGWRTSGWLTRTDAEGRELWSRRVGDTGYDRIFSARGTADGGYVLAGGRGNSAWLLKLGADGSEQWSRTLARDGSAEAVAQLPDGGFALAGDRFGTIKGGNAGWATRTSAAGDELWTARFPGSAEEVASTPDGGVVVGGATAGQMGQLLRLRPDGQVEWHRTYRSGSIVRAVARLPDGGYAVAGNAGSSFWLLRTDEAGNERWWRNYTRTQGYEGAEAHALVPMQDGGFVLVGKASEKLWVVRADSTGAMVWNRTVGES